MSPMHPRMTPRRTARSFGSLCKGCAYSPTNGADANTEYKRLTDQRFTYSTHEHHSDSSAARLFRLRQNDAVCAKIDHSPHSWRQDQHRKVGRSVWMGFHL